MVLEFYLSGPVCKAAVGVLRENGICQKWNLSESVFCHFLKKLEYVRMGFVGIGVCQNRNLSESKFVRIGICQNWIFFRIGNCQNFKTGQIKS